MSINSRGKNIVILSTEPWGKMLLSKMHYANVLVEQGNRVFFINPPRETKGSPLVDIVEQHAEGRLTIADIRAIAGSLFLRHKLFPVFKMISRRYARAIRRLVGEPIDEVWCFNPHVFVDLRAFKAKRSILMIYDFYKGDHIFRTAATADAFITISQLILDHYRECPPRKLLMQHGLSRSFATRAAGRLKDIEHAARPGNKIRVGYMGNLLRAGMNTDIAREVITKHGDKEFHFWGPCSLEDNNVTPGGATTAADLVSFIEFLRGRDNVILHGMKDQESLAEGLSTMDVFLFLYSPRTEMNSASNAHKILEYLSTGKVVVSTHVSNYAGTGLLTMTDKDREEDFPALFETVTGRLSFYNDVDQQKKRIAFALDNTYSRQVERIQEFIYKP
ncbi:MAG TPA: hypothetical protein VGQ51_12895 [Puia sp.]|jgi:hypothetical protein|nr:hypothetical protein [Puia sp.]